MLFSLAKNAFEVRAECDELVLVWIATSAAN